MYSASSTGMSWSESESESGLVWDWGVVVLMRFARVIEGGSTSKRLRFMGTGGGDGEERGWGEAGLGGVAFVVGMGIASQSVVHSDPSCAFVVINCSSASILARGCWGRFVVPPSFGVRWPLCRHRS
jgi:hypothetical protein